MFRRSVLLELVLVATTAAFQAQAQNEPYWPQPPADAGPAHPDINSHQVLVDKFNNAVGGIVQQAIWYHGGEAQGARDDFMGLLSGDQKLLLSFLGRLRTPERPNEELLPLP